MKCRLLIVEDDNNIRNGLIKIIEKMELPLEDIFAAANGSEALSIVREIDPHIIITDIRMPLMNGLDFIENVASMNSLTKTIILSGYSDFSYAQRAIRFNVSDYLLKPIKKEKLKSVLEKLIDEIKTKLWEKEQKAINARKAKEYHMMFMKEMMEGYQSLSDIDYVFSNAVTLFGKTGYVVYSIYCKATRELLWDFLDSSSQRLCIVFKYFNQYGHIICLVNMNMGEYNDSSKQLEALLSCYSEENRINVYAGVSEWSNKTSHLAELVRQAEKTVDLRLLRDSSQVIRYSEIKRQNTGKTTGLNIYYAEIKNASQRCDMKGVEAGADKLFEFLLGSCPVTPSLLKNSIAGYILYCMPPDKQELIIKSINDIESIYQMSDTVNDFRILVKHMLKKLCKSTQEDNERLYGNKINAAVKFIEENYNKNIYLETVANHVNANASYFSSTFKRTTGVYFSDYLQKIRIEKAKSLLMEPAYKIYEIAEKTGFLDEKYFFKVFKKLTGVTPSQYRNGILTSEEMPE